MLDFLPLALHSQYNPFASYSSPSPLFLVINNVIKEKLGIFLLMEGECWEPIHLMVFQEGLHDRHIWVLALATEGYEKRYF